MKPLHPGISEVVAFYFEEEKKERSTFGAIGLRPTALEEKTESMAMQHDSFARNTRAQLKQVFDAIRELMTPPETKKRPIGFVTSEEKPKK